MFFLRLIVPTLLAAAAFAASVSPSSAQTEAGGFYRESDEPEVMYQYTPGLFCHVQNEAQMEAFGGFGEVMVVPRIRMVGRQTGDCGWPNGFYRYSDAPAVYRLSGRGIVPDIGSEMCHVADEQQMEAFGGFGLVRVIPLDSDLGNGRDNIGDCWNP